MMDRMELVSLKVSIDDLQIHESYNRIYNTDTDISNIVEVLKENKKDYNAIIVDTNNNILFGIDTWRAFKQLNKDGEKGFKKIKVNVVQCSNEDEVILEMITRHDYTNCSKEELCRAVYVYYESYRKAYPQGNDKYLTAKQLLPCMPEIFHIKKEDGKGEISSAVYEHWIAVGRKMWLLEEQERIEDLECLYILINNISVGTIKKSGTLAKIDSWTDEDRAEIRKNFSCKGEFYRRLHRINSKHKANEETIVDEPKSIKELIADLHDEERDRSLNDVDLAYVSFDNVRSAINSIKNTIEEEGDKPKITIESKQIACQIIDELRQFADYITNYFEL